MDQKRIACILVDGRSMAAARRLSALGLDVVVWGDEEWCEKSKCCVASSFCTAIADCQAILLPTPAFDGQGRVNLGGGASGASAENIFSFAGEDIPVFAGLVSENIKDLAYQHHVQLIDYMQEQELQWRNAIPTAEGAICLAMQRLDQTLHGARVAVLGYGRIAMALCERLDAWGAKVTVAARSPSALTRIDLAGYRPLSIKDEHSLLPLMTGYDVIFNTVPYRLLTESLLTQLHPKTILVELASTPGGWDPALVEEKRVIYAPGLPGKYAPKTAGDIVAHTVFSLLKEVKTS